MRSKIVLISFIVAIPIVLLRYAQLQLFEYKARRAYIDSLRTKIVEISPMRGRIISSDGKILAWSEEIFKAKAIGRVPKDVEDILGEQRFSKIIRGEEIEVSKVEAELLEKRGIRVRKEFVRRYSKIAPHVVGYVDSDGNGVSGVERAYDDLLKGKKGSMLVVIDPSGKVVGKALETPPVPGDDVILTIDSKLQKIAQDALKKLGKPGAIVVMNVKDGSILAMASHPSFDPNLLSGRLSSREWRRISRDPKSPFMNRAISASYPPGSSIKPFVALSYLLKFGFKDEKIDCRGKFEYRGKEGKVLATYWDWLKTGHGITDLKKALRVSCNIFFYKVGLEVGIDFMRKVASIVDLDGKTGIDIPGEIKGLFPSRSWKEERFGEPWYPGNTILLSIGQGFISLTPIELLEFYTLIANEGVEYVPHVVKSERKIRLKVDFPREYWKFLKDALLEVTTYPGGPEDAGTAYHAFKGFDVKVAGKTGTAEVPGGTHSWFVGFAPYEDPKVAIVVVVERGGSGGSVAAPLAREILSSYFYPSR